MYSLLSYIEFNMLRHNINVHGLYESYIWIHNMEFLLCLVYSSEQYLVLGNTNVVPDFVVAFIRISRKLYFVFISSFDVLCSFFSVVRNLHSGTCIITTFSFVHGFHWIGFTIICLDIWMACWNLWVPTHL